MQVTSKSFGTKIFRKTTNLLDKDQRNSSVDVEKERSKMELTDNSYNDFEERNLLKSQTYSNLPAKFDTYGHQR